MYPILIVTHSWIRWIVLGAGVVALARGIAGMRGRRPWTGRDDRATLFFSIALDVQLLIGLSLLGLLGGAAGSRRVLEHVGGMVMAVALAHIGRRRIRRQTASEDRHRVAVLFIGLSLAAILFSIPWSAALFRF